MDQNTFYENFRNQLRHRSTPGTCKAELNHIETGKKSHCTLCVMVPFPSQHSSAWFSFDGNFSFDGKRRVEPVLWVFRGLWEGMVSVCLDAKLLLQVKEWRGAACCCTKGPASLTRMPPQVNTNGKKIPNVWLLPWYRKIRVLIRTAVF